MKKHRFTASEKFSLWHAYKKMCFYCKELIPFQEVTIDHILPEVLIETPKKLLELKEYYGLDRDFSINDYENWVPCHAHCNQEKGSKTFPASPAMINQLDIAEKKAKKARVEESKLTKSLRSAEILGKMEVSIEKGEITRQEVARLLENLNYQQQLLQPFVVTFGINIIDLLNEDERLRSLSLDYPQLCDFLENELQTYINSLISSSYFYPEQSNRTGETLSVRLAFLNLDLDELEKFRDPLWELLEIQYFSDIYGENSWSQYIPD